MIAATVGGNQVPVAAIGVPRLFTGSHPSAQMGMQDHLAGTGVLPRVSLGQLVNFGTSARLTGRSGGTFLVPDKFSSLHRGRRSVGVNAGEGEPASFNDRALILRRPHLVLGGAVLGAEAITARTVQVAVHDAGVRGALLRAIADSPDGRRFRAHGSSAGNPADTVAECG